MITLFKRHYSTHKEVVDNFVWRVLQIFGQQGITLLIFIMCAKMLTPYDFGIYNYALSIIFFLVMFSDFGISTAASKYVAEYNLTDKEKLKTVLFNCGLVIFTITCVIATLNAFFGNYLFKDKIIYVYYLLPILFLAPMIALYDGIYRGLKRFRQLAILSSVIGGVSAFAVYFFIKNFGLQGALFFQDLFYLGMFIALAVSYRDYNFKFNKVVIKEITSYSLIYGLAIAGNYLFIRFGILILGHFGYINEIATYELLNKMFLVIVIPFTMLGQVVAPNFTEMSVHNDYLKIYSKLKKYSFIFLFVGIIMGIFFYFTMPLFIKIFFPKYDNVLFYQILPFSIIILSTNLWAATIDAGILIPTGFASLMARLYIVLGVFGSILGFLLTLKIGYMGVIYSFALSNILMVACLRFIFFKKIYFLKKSLILR